MQMRFLTDMRLSQTGKSIPDAEWLILDTAFLVVFGFDEKDAEMVGKIEAAIKQFQMRETDKFIELVYIDASKKLSASKLYTV